MKPRFWTFFLALAVSAAAPSVGLAQLVWDTSTTAGYQNANGTWGTDNFWTTTTGGGTTLTAWTAGNEAWFGGNSTVAASPGGDFTITVSGSQRVSIARQIQNGAGNFTLQSGTLHATGFRVDQGTMTVNSTIVTGTGANNWMSFTAINGTNTMILGGDNTFTNIARIGGNGSAGGKIFLNHQNALGLGTEVLFGNGASLDLNGYSIGGKSISVTDTRTGILVNTGTAAVVWSGDVLLSNTTPTNFRAGGTGGEVNISGVISGSIGNQVQSFDNGTLRLSGVNTYSGTTVVRDGSTLIVGNASALGSTAAGTIINVGTLDLNGFNVGNEAFTLQQTTSRLVNNSTSSAATVGGNVTISLATGTIGGAGNLTLGGVISSAVTGGFSKIGSGTLTLTGNNTYSGTTTVGNGVLRFNTVAAGANAQALGAGTVVNLGVASTSSGEIDYYGASSGTLEKNVFALGNGRNRIRNSGSALTLSGTLTKNGTILELAGGTFNVTGRITGTTVGTSDLFVDGATVTLSNTNNDYNGPTYVFGGGSLALGASNVIPNNSALILGGTGSDTGTGTITTGLFTDTIASLTTSSLGATVGISGSSATIGGLTTTGNLTFGAGTDTLALSLTSPTLGRYTLMTYAGTRSGTFDSVTGNGNYNVVYGAASNGTIDLQLKANQAATFSLTPAASRVLVGGSTQLSGVLANTSPTDSAALSWNPASTGTLTASGFTSSAGSTIAAGSTSTITAWVAAGNTAGPQPWSITNTDNSAITTVSTATGSISVVNQRSFNLSSGTINAGTFLRTLGASGSTSVTSLGVYATTASGTLGSFSPTNTNGLTLTTSDATAFNGAPTQTATYLLGGSATSAGAINGNFTSNVSAELGSISPLTVSLSGTALDPAVASFASGSTAASLLLDFGEVNQNASVSPLNFSLFNLMQTSGFTADLALLEIVSGTGNNGAITTSLSTFNTLAAGSSNPYTASFTTSTLGAFQNVYTLRFKSSNGGNVYSSDTQQSLTLTVQGVIIVPEPGALALAGIGIAAAAWARRRHKKPGAEATGS